nr:hypothetical protein [Mycolicibacterium mucogenicum]
MQHDTVQGSQDQPSGLVDVNTGRGSRSLDRRPQCTGDKGTVAVVLPLRHPVRVSMAQTVDHELELHQLEGRIVFDEAPEHKQRLAHRVLGCRMIASLRVLRIAPQRFNLVANEIYYCADQFVFVRERVVHRTQREAGLLGHLAGGRRFQPHVGDHLYCRVDELLTTFVGAL